MRITLLLFFYEQFCKKLIHYAFKIGFVPCNLLYVNVT